MVSRRLRRSFLATAKERDHLAELSTTLNKRNDQFKALYQVVSEVTDNLSMRYVVNTTVEQALKLVGADYVELRLLQADSLVSTGHACSDLTLDVTSGPLDLGEGLAGRAAKRGKTMLLH